MVEISCTLAAPSEVAACVALLPETWGVTAEWLIARRGGALAGAAALVWRSWSTPGGFPLWLRVGPDHRRRGVGRALATAAGELALGEAAGLWAIKPVTGGSEAALFLEACGFEVRGRDHHFRVPLAVALIAVRARADRALTQGGPAARARIVDLDESHVEAVSWLVSSGLGGDGPLATQRVLRRRLDPTAPESWAGSQVAMIDGQVAGVLLRRVEDGVGVVDVAVVTERWRGLRLTSLMMRRVLERCLAEGLTDGRFHSRQTVTDTFDIPRRMDWSATPTELRYYRPAPPGPGRGF